jgi:ATP-dependent DNA helicase RecG
VADLVKDRSILEVAKNYAEDIIKKDPELKTMENLRLNEYLISLKEKTLWSKIS